MRRLNHEIVAVCVGVDPAVCMVDPLCRTHDVDDWRVVDSVCCPASAATGPAVTPRRE
jgi:choline dehydrogenase-like flavoprotein